MLRMGMRTLLGALEFEEKREEIEEHVIDG